MSSWVIWLIVVAGNVSLVANIITTILVITFIATAVFGGVSLLLGADCDGCDGGNEDSRKGIACISYVRKKAWIILVPLLISVFTPTTRECAAIYVLPKIINKAQESELPEQWENLAIEWCRQEAAKIKADAIESPK